MIKDRGSVLAISKSPGTVSRTAASTTFSSGIGTSPGTVSRILRIRCPSAWPGTSRRSTQTALVDGENGAALNRPALGLQPGFQHVVGAKESGAGSHAKVAATVLVRATDQLQSRHAELWEPSIEASEAALSALAERFWNRRPHSPLGSEPDGWTDTQEHAVTASLNGAN